MIDFPMAWEISQSVPPEDHDPECSTAVTGGAILCDCDILWDAVKADEEKEAVVESDSTTQPPKE